ncbi:hypothetical protein MSG28_012309 [Choristoneura fumiferana]|uniref:Uncharacterized protein n=1 Tax=Choristoneura fumiferana TaxID=7141 RepID=A0ACC0KCF6_CHOFU|nr:hypothetical protein MSG28_012309 [Choristoneura fumiferana]
MWRTKSRSRCKPEGLKQTTLTSLYLQPVQCCGNFPNSQHRPIVTDIGLKIPLANSMPVPRWNFGRADWDGFRVSLDTELAAANLEPIASNYGKFVELVIKAAKVNIPRGYRKEYVPGWNSDSEKLYHEYQESEDQSAGAALLHSLDRSRKEKWESAVGNMDFKRSSRKAWKVLHRLSGKQHPQKLSLKVNPDAIANRMHLSRPFSIGEVVDGIKLLKYGKAAGPDNIFNEFIRAMGPVSVGWLAALFDYILLNNRLPKEFKLAKVIAVLKPGKTDDRPENFRPISLLSCIYKLLERLILARITPYVEAVIPLEQAGFRGGRSCTDQVLALTTHIEAGFQRQLKSTAVFVDLTAAYDTVWKQGLLFKIIKTIPSREIADIIMSMLSEREFEVYLGKAKSRKRKLNNGLPQGSVLAPTLFNLYIHDLPPTEATKFIYADDIALVFQGRDFKSGEEVLSSDLSRLNEYFSSWRLIPSPSKTEVACFHLNNRMANYQPAVSFKGELLKYNPCPKYLGVTLDRTLTYKEHLQKVSLKVASRNNILHKLCGTTWGASADCLRTSAAALVFSAAEYCAPVWLESAHVQKVDTKLNEAMRCVSGTIKSTPLHWLPVLSHIAPPHLRRMQALKREAEKIQADQSLPVHQPFCHPPPQRLKSRHPACVTAQNLGDFDIKQRWKDEWNAQTTGTALQTIDPRLPRKLWCRLNRLRTGHGRCHYFRHKWGWRDSALCECGEEAQTMEHIVQRCPLHSYSGSPGDLYNLTPDLMSWLGTLNVDL